MARVTGISPTAQFQLRVVESLTRLETLAEATTEHLKRLNGSAARHEDQIGLLKQDAARRQDVETLRQGVEAAKTAIASEEAGRKATAIWWRMVAPLVWLAVGGVLVLFLTHSQDMLRVFSKP